MNKALAPIRGIAGMAVAASLAVVLGAAGPVHAATFTVNSTGDASDASPGDGVCATAGSVCTLRAAQQEADALPGVDAIEITSGLAVAPSGDIPFATTLTLTCLGATCCTGLDCGDANWPTSINFGNAAGGLKFSGDNVTVHGCEVYGVSGSDSTAYAILISGDDGRATCNNVHDNWGGIVITGVGGVIGGTNSGDANWAHGNHFGLTLLTGNTAARGNVSGTSADGLSAAANASYGVYIEAGDSATADGNLVAGNGGSGVYVKADATNAIVTNNLIGRNRTDSADLCNGIPQIDDHGTSTTISGNTVGTCATPTATPVVSHHCCQLADGSGLGNAGSTCVDDVWFQANFGDIIDNVGGCAGLAGFMSTTATADEAASCSPEGDLAGVCQPAGPTNTPAATSTPTPGPSSTPTLTRAGALALQATCASPPCTYADTEGLFLQAGARGRTMTVGVRTTAGSATVVPYCRITAGHLPVEFALGALTGASCATGGNCAITTSATCDALFLAISGCTSCRVNGWVRSSPR